MVKWQIKENEKYLLTWREGWTRKYLARCWEVQTEHSAVLNSGYYLNHCDIGMLTYGKTKRNDPQNDELQKMIGIKAQCKSMEPCPLFTSVVHNFS